MVTLGGHHRRGQRRCILVERPRLRTVAATTDVGVAAVPYQTAVKPDAPAVLLKGSGIAVADGQSFGCTNLTI